MKGNNRLLLNESTMIEALQHYFDTVAFKRKVKVDGIEERNQGGRAFEIKISECDGSPIKSGMTTEG